MKLRKLCTTSEALPLSRCMSSKISSICFKSGDCDFSMILAVSVLLDCAQRLIDFVRDTGGHLAGRGETIDVRELHHPLPRVHLRRLAAMPLKHQERDETTS